MTKLQKQKKAYLEKLAATGVKLEVTSAAHAKSDEVISYAIERLQAGCTYAELRRELGLGPASHDKRWRELRQALCDYILPKSEEEAMLQANNDAQFWINKLEGLIGELDDKIKMVGDCAKYFDDDSQEWVLVESSSLPAMLKTKHDVIKTIIENKKKLFNDYMEIQKLRKAEKSTGGVSITINNNIPRPDKTMRDVGDIAKSGVIQAAKVIGKIAND